MIDKETNSTYNISIQLRNGVNIKPAPMTEGLLITASQCSIPCVCVVALQKQQSPQQMNWIWCEIRERYKNEIIIKNHTPNDRDNERLDTKERDKTMPFDFLARRGGVACKLLAHGFKLNSVRVRNVHGEQKRIKC